MHSAYSGQAALIQPLPSLPTLYNAVSFRINHAIQSLRASLGSITIKALLNTELLLFIVV